MEIFDLKQAAFLGTVALVAVPGTFIAQEKSQANPSQTNLSVEVA